MDLTEYNHLEGLIPLKSELYPFTQLQIDWLEALRSGKYKQGMGYLRDKNGAYCCLGVLCKLAGYQSKNIGDNYAEAFLDEVGAMHCSYLPFSAVKKAFLNSSLGKFNGPVRFPGIAWGEKEVADATLDFDGGGKSTGHTSLGSMNDARVIKVGEKMRAFTFMEIADYIEFDPWNVFTAPIEETITPG